MSSNSGLQSRTTRAPTSTTWAELRTSDPAAAELFYSGLFGWAYYSQPMPDGPQFSVAMARGRPIAVIAPAIPAHHQPPQWISHCGVDEVDQGPMARINSTASERNRAVTRNRSVVAANTHDPTLARRTPDSRGPHAPHDSDSYTMFLIGGVPLAGIATAHAPEAPNCQQVSFAVADTDTALARVTTLGGRVLTDPTDTPTGRICRVADPQGAAFNVLQSVEDY